MLPEPFAAVTLARILRPWGRRGEVAAEILTDFPQRLASLREVWLADGQRPAWQATVLSCRLHKGQAVFHFAGVSSIDEAEKLRGAEVQVPLSQRMELSEGRYYISELVGCEVWITGGAEVLGKIKEVQPTHAGQETPEAWVLAVETARGEVLIPFAAEICTLVDVSARRIEVRLPEGLLDLNQ